MAEEMIHICRPQCTYRRQFRPKTHHLFRRLKIMDSATIEDAVVDACEWLARHPTFQGEVRVLSVPTEEWAWFESTVAWSAKIGVKR